MHILAHVPAAVQITLKQCKRDCFGVGVDAPQKIRQVQIYVAACLRTLVSRFGQLETQRPVIPELSYDLRLGPDNLASASLAWSAGAGWALGFQLALRLP